MNEPNLAVLNAYKTALASMTVSGQAIPVYSKAAPLKDVPKKYIILSTQGKTQNITGCGYWYDCTMTVQIVTRYPNGQGDIEFAYTISEEVQERIQNTGISLSNFRNFDTRQISATDIILETQTENLYQYIIIFNHKLNRA